MRDRLHRFVWLFLAILFVVTALGVGVYAFWINTHGGGTQSNVIQCAKGSGKPPNQQPKNGKVKGAQLADYKPGKKIDYLSCIDYKTGTGAAVQTTSTVTVKYVGALASTGEIFDSSFDTGQPLTIQLTQVIQGWSNGLEGMKVGGIRRLFIPSQYGYGPQAIPGIPPNSDLVFDVQLVSIK